MIATLLGQVKQYKKDSILTPFFTAVEVLMEVLIPFVTAQIIDKGIEAGNMKNVILRLTDAGSGRGFPGFRYPGGYLCSQSFFRLCL